MTEKLAFKFDLIEIHLNFTWYVALVATVLQSMQNNTKNQLKMGKDFFLFSAFMLLPFLTWEGSLSIETMAKETVIENYVY